MNNKRYDQSAKTNKGPIPHNDEIERLRQENNKLKQNLHNLSQNKSKPYTVGFYQNE